jgi:hypothetical protein
MPLDALLARANMRGRLIQSKIESLLHDFEKIMA